ncbi:DUF6456 domain-containing protein [Cohaesibacter intestini]|uniref:DUF6456 domain-containing protein n=1 Tax=Cohaesibacter intestini TaxID=2211145 RepID=UPI001FDF250A|nr:DUF6456 domain-containing protein [Cohaesibacter intestini]
MMRPCLSVLSADEVRLLKACLKSKAAGVKAKEPAVLHDLLSKGCLKQEGEQISVTPEGRQALRRAQLAKEEDLIFAAQHQVRTRMVKDPANNDVSDMDRGQPLPKGAEHQPRPWINRKESPLAALALRKKPDGNPMLSSSQFEAGERFRLDFERGQMAPMMGINWDKLGKAGGGKGQGSFGRIEISDNAMGARQRFSQAALYVGDELFGILVDFCCFLKGLETIERERQWPARSAKQILSLALDRLARHYGLSEKAQGPLQNLIRHWGTEDYRPQV